MIRLFRVFVPASVVALLVSEFVLTYTCFVLASLVVLDVDPQVFLFDDNGLARIGIVVACFILGTYFHDLYTQFRIKSRVVLFQQTGVVMGIAFLVQALLAYLNLQDLTLPSSLMIAGSALTIILLPVWRIFYSGIVLKAMGSEQVLFVGTSSVVQEIAQYLGEHPESGIRPLGFIDSPSAGLEIRGGNVLGDIPDLERIVDQLQPDRIVVGAQDTATPLPVTKLLEMRLLGIQIEDALTTYEATFGRISTLELRPSQLILSTELEPNQNRLALQSVYALAIAAVAAAIASPVILLAALLVKLSSAGPALTRQQCMGEHEIPFTLYKFRSTYYGAQVQTAAWVPNDDPRVTPLGRLLRKLRIDGLPQLFNVLKGDMSIVGPRPERAEFSSEIGKLIPCYGQRYYVKPGITGWAQINHKSSGAVEDTIVKLEYDLYYIKNLAPALDALIMFHTAKAMLLSGETG